jgi:hypothetical protein
VSTPDGEGSSSEGNWSSERARAFDEQLDEYHLALGRFVTAFAEVETQLRWVCFTTVMPDWRFAGPLFGGLTVAQGVKTLRDLRKVKGGALDPELDRALIHLGTISEMRNAIMHRGVEFGEQSMQTGRSMPNGRGQQLPTSAEALRDMRADLNTIKAAMMIAVPIDDPSWRSWAQQLRSQAAIPWRYKPSA